ncbi:MAG TPA: hypothetical protein ENG81_00800 [Candidatus Bathyarchaeota archaeon]|nr:hypothetical protein [Candidatus Bathyarchaeota archaeon]
MNWLKLLNGGFIMVEAERKFETAILSRLILGFLTGVANYILYSYVPTLIYSFLSSSLNSTAYQEAMGFQSIYMVDFSILGIFLLLSIVNSLLWNSWLGFLFNIFTSSIYFAYAVLALDFGKLSFTIQGMKISIDFSIILAVWFISLILDLVAKLFKLVESEAPFTPTF